MIPVFAIVGRPNVGKSTLFNRLTKTRDALVDNQPGVTRDRLYGRGKIDDKRFLVVDTGGLEPEHDQFSAMIKEQVDQVIAESDVILFIVDSAAGVVPQDMEIANQLRRSDRQVFLLVNKSEGITSDLITAEFQELAVGSPVAVSAKRGDGIESLFRQILSGYAVESDADHDLNQTPHMAIVGRPNVGKSTLTNKLCGEHRVIVSDIPGTTRDSVHIPISIGDQPYVLIDTAGVRRKSRVREVIEKFSVIKTLQAIENSHVVLLVIDASTEIEAQDATIAGMVNTLGKSIVLVVNKWDGLDARKRTKIKKEIDSKLSFLAKPEMITISALHGSNVRKVMPAAQRAYDSAMVEIATSSLNRTLADAITQTPPPMHNQRPIRLKFVHQAGKNPPRIVIHGNKVNHIPESYLRYLCRYFARAYRLAGTPIRIATKVGENPFKGRNPEKKTHKQRSGRRRKL